MYKQNMFFNAKKSIIFSIFSPGAVLCAYIMQYIEPAELRSSDTDRERGQDIEHSASSSNIKEIS